jgi:hypothetical protein
MATVAIDSGAAERTLARWVEVSNLEDPSANDPTQDAPP